MVIKILVWIGPERIAVVVTAIAVGLKVEVEVDHRLGVICTDMLQAPE